MISPTFCILLLLIFDIFQPSLARENASAIGKPIIIDTDMFSDVDDVGALAVANVLHNCGLADLRAVMINTRSRYGAQAASVISTYFGNGHIPIGAIWPLNNDTFLDTYTYRLGEYASKVSYNFPRSLNSSSSTRTPTQLYESILTSASNASITLISLGFLTNLATLLDSARGRDLVSTKVRELVIMGGTYPSGWEFNLASHPSDSAAVVNSFPSHIPITYSGYELGKAIFSGADLRTHAPRESPVLAAYEWYVGRCETERESWDPLTVLYGVLGLESGFFEYANVAGRNWVNASDGTNKWMYDTDGENNNNQHWLKLVDGVTNTSVAWALTQFFAHDPESEVCPM